MRVYTRFLTHRSSFFTLQGEKGTKGDPGPMGLPVRIFSPDYTRIHASARARTHIHTYVRSTHVTVSTASKRGCRTHQDSWHTKQRNNKPPPSPLRPVDARRKRKSCKTTLSSLSRRENSVRASVITLSTSLSSVAHRDDCIRNLRIDSSRQRHNSPFPPPPPLLHRDPVVASRCCDSVHDRLFAHRYESPRHHVNRIDIVDTRYSSKCCFRDENPGPRGESRVSRGTQLRNWTRIPPGIRVRGEEGRASPSKVPHTISACRYKKKKKK